MSPTAERSTGHHRVGRRLAVEHPGLRRDGGGDVGGVAHVDKGEVEAERSVDPLHEPVAAAVDVVAADDVVALLEELEDGVEGRESGPEREADWAPSRAATLRSSASRVGLAVRAYS